MIWAAVLFLLFKTHLADSNVCIPDGSGDWASSVLFDVQDFAFGGLAKVSNKTCFDGCLQSETVVQSYKLDVSVRSARPHPSSRVMVSQDTANDAQLCADTQLGQQIQYAVEQSTDNTAAAVLKSILYGMSLPGGWAIAVVKNANGWSDAPATTEYCYYIAQLRADYYQVTLAYVG